MMVESGERKIPVAHMLGGVLAIALITMHFLFYSEMYLELVTEGVSLQSFGAGKVLLANVVIFGALVGALVCLILAALRSFRARSSTTFLPTVLLLAAGYLLPWVGIMIGWFIAGDAM